MERKKILNAFPAALRQEVEKVIEILPLNNHDNFSSSNEQLIYFDKEELKIPYRFYFNEPSPDKEKLLTALQKTILNCIYLRHNNGFVRQRRLESLVDRTEYFIVPFGFQLLGEYVLEILEVLDKHINSATLDNYAKLITENQKYWVQTESRMISYWNVYYRRQKFRKLNDYIGKQIVDRLKKRMHNIIFHNIEILPSNTN